MSEISEAREAQHAAERQDQKDLTGRVGTTLTRQAKSSNLKWGTWLGRLGIRRRTP